MSEPIQPQFNHIDLSVKSSNSGFLIFSFVVMFLLIIAVLFPLDPNDFYPYVRIGQEIIKTGAIPSTEFMTYTQFGKPVDYLNWLPSLIFMEVFKLGGFTLTAIIVMVCVASFYSLLWLCLRELKIHPLVSGIVLLITGLTGASFFTLRPQIFAFPLFGMALLALVRWQKQDDRLLWYLPVVAMLWVNLHGSFVILFFLLLPALIFGIGNRKRLMVIVVLALLATFINRYGIDIWRNLFSIVNNESNRLFSMEFQLPVNKGWQANVIFGSLLITPVLTAIAKPKIPFLYWIWFLGFGWMALSGVRYGIWFLGVESLILTMLLNPLFDRFLKPSSRFQNRFINLVIGFIMLVFPMVLLPGIRGLWWEQAPPLFRDNTPVKAVEWLKQNPQLPGELWSDFNFSTYMTYMLPERKLFMTNRMDDFPVEQFEDNESISDGQFDWQFLLDKYRINLMMASVSLQPELIRAASSSPIWSEVYRDNQAVIFVR